MKKIILILSLYITFFHIAMSFASENRFTICVFDYPPYHYETSDGKPAGLAVDLIALVLKKMNVVYDVKFVPYARGQIMLKTGKASMFLTSGKNKERQEYAYFPSTSCYIGQWGWFILDKNKDTLRYDKIEDLKGRSFGWIRGTYMDPAVRDYIEANSHFEEGKDEITNLKKLSHGRLDYVYGEMNSGPWWQKKEGLQKMHFLSQRIVVSANMYPTFSKKIVSKEFVDRFSAELAKIKNTGVFKELLAKYDIRILDFDYSKVDWLFME